MIRLLGSRADRWNYFSLFLIFMKKQPVCSSAHNVAKINKMWGWFGT